MNVDKELLLIGFDGMTYRESCDYQLKHWVDGISLHNPVGDECCPDFSCCTGNIMDKKLRVKFQQASLEGDGETRSAILGMALSNLASTINAKVHVAGEDPNQH